MTTIRDIKLEAVEAPISPKQLLEICNQHIITLLGQDVFDSITPCPVEFLGSCEVVYTVAIPNHVPFYMTVHRELDHYANQFYLRCADEDVFSFVETRAEFGKFLLKCDHLYLKEMERRAQQVIDITRNLADKTWVFEAQNPSNDFVIEDHLPHEIKESLQRLKEVRTTVAAQYEVDVLYPVAEHNDRVVAAFVEKHTGSYTYYKHSPKKRKVRLLSHDPDERGFYRCVTKDGRVTRIKPTCCIELEEAQSSGKKYRRKIAIRSEKVIVRQESIWVSPTTDQKDIDKFLHSLKAVPETLSEYYVRLRGK